MGTLWRDTRYSSRMLARNPGFAAVVILVLGLGIGAATSVFSIVNGVLLQALPYKDPGSTWSWCSRPTPIGTNGRSLPA